MSQQPDEKYWTDYVRVATPIVGLLLLLGVFWYWANSLIGADSSAPPPTTIVTLVPDDTPTPTPTVEPTEDPGEGVTPPTTEEVPATETPGGEPATRTPRPPDEATDTPESEPTEETPCDQQWCEGDTIITTSDVRMRSEPSTDAEIVEELDANVELVVLNNEPEEQGGYVWWNVRDEASGEEGWVVEDWLGLPS